MFNVGGMELVAIAVLALVVLGPDRLPSALRQIGSALGRIRQISDGFRTEVQSAIAEVDPRSAMTAAVPSAPAPAEQQDG